MRLQYIAAIALSVASAFAQPQVSRLMMVQVKPGHEAEFQDLQAKISAAYEKTGTSLRYIWAPSGFGDQRTWYGVTSLKSLGEFDSPPVKAILGEGEYERFLTRSAAAIDGVRYLTIESRPNLSIQTKEKLGGLWQLSTVQVQFGKEAAFEELMERELLPAMKKAGIKAYLVNRVMLGGMVGTYFLATPLKSLKDLDGGSVAAKALGPEAWQAFRTKLGALIVSAETDTLRVVSELSYDKSRN
jgi:hypothetical protein